MSRYKQRKLAQLCQTVQEKVGILQRQQADFLRIIDEYISEVKVSAARLLSSQDEEVDVDRYLHIIRQLDRRSQVCLQLTSKAYDIIDGSESGGEDDALSRTEVRDGQDSDNDHPHTSTAAGSRQQSVGSTEVMADQHPVVLAVRDSMSACMSACSGPEADQSNMHHQPHGHHHHHHQDTSSSTTTTTLVSNVHLHQHDYLQTAGIGHNPHPDSANLNTALINAYSSYQTAALTNPYAAAAQLSTPLGQSVAYPYGALAEASMAVTHSAAHVGTNLAQPGTVVGGMNLNPFVPAATCTVSSTGGCIDKGVSMSLAHPGTVDMHLGTNLSHLGAISGHINTHPASAEHTSGSDFTSSKSADSHLELISAHSHPVTQTNLTSAHPVIVSLPQSFAPPVVASAVPVSVSITLPDFTSSGPSVDHCSSDRNSAEGAGVERDTYWRFGIGTQRISMDHAVPLSVCFVENPWSFYVLLSEVTVTRLTQEIRNHVEHGTESLPVPEIGALCLAKYTDGMHYRARIQQISGETVGVYFLDFGNVLTALQTELLVLPDVFKNLPPLAIHCCLSGVMPVGESGLWTETAVNLFTQYVTAQMFMCKAVQEQSENPRVPTLVELFQPTPTPVHPGSKNMKQEVTNISLASILIEQNVAQPVSTSKLLQLLTAADSDSLPLGAEAANYTSSGVVSPSLSTQMKKSKNKQVSEEKRAVLSPKAKEFVPNLQHVSHKVPRMPAVSAHLVSQETCCAMEMGIGSQQADSGDLCSETVSKSPSSQHGKGFDLKGNKRHSKNMPSAAERKRSTVVNGKGDLADVQALAHAATSVNSSDVLMHKGVNNVEVYTQGISPITPSGEASHGNSTTDANLKGWMGVQALLFGADSVNKNVVTSFSAMTATVHSPTDFYMHRVSETTGTRLKNMMVDLNREFEHMHKATMERQRKSFVAKPGSVCCARFSKDNCFYRAFVLDTQVIPDMSDSSDSPDRQALQISIFYIDFGDKEWLPSSRVFPLPVAYQYVAPQALWCSLSCIKPCTFSSPGKKGTVSEEWSAEACKAFTELLGTDRVLTVIAQTDHEPVEKYRADAVQKKPMPVFLIDQDNNDLCINHELILLQQAVFFRDVEASEPVSVDEGAVADIGKEDDEDGWDDMKRDTESLRNSYKVDIGDAGVALTGVKSRGGSRGVCRFYNRPSSCWKGDRCVYLHVDPGAHPDTSGNLKQVLVYDEDQLALLPEEGALVAVEVSSFLTPAHFYVVLPWGPLTISEVSSLSSKESDCLQGETLEKVNKAMNEFYKRKRIDTDYSVYALGEAVAAYCRRTGGWMRAKVIDTDPDKEEVLVMFVDFGEKEWISEHDIRQLEKRFIHLPPQAVECCLNGVVPPRPGGSWPAESRREFYELINKKTLAARVVKRMWSGRLMVELFDTSSMVDLEIGSVLVSRGLASLDRGQTRLGTPSRCKASARDGGDEVHYVPG